MFLFICLFGPLVIYSTNPPHLVVDWTMWTTSLSSSEISHSPPVAPWHAKLSKELPCYHCDSGNPPYLRHLTSCFGPWHLRTKSNRRQCVQDDLQVKFFSDSSPVFLGKASLHWVVLLNTCAFLLPFCFPTQLSSRERFSFSFSHTKYFLPLEKKSLEFSKSSREISSLYGRNLMVCILQIVLKVLTGWIYEFRNLVFKTYWLYLKLPFAH